MSNDPALNEAHETPLADRLVSDAVQRWLDRRYETALAAADADGKIKGIDQMRHLHLADWYYTLVPEVISELRRAGLMIAADWRPFDVADKVGTAPPRGELVWIAPAQDYGIPVTVGQFDGFTFWDKDGYDDLRVTHWAPIAWPAPPQEGAQP